MCYISTIPNPILLRNRAAWTRKMTPDTINFREEDTEDIPAMSVVRLSITENALSNPNVITRAMYEEHLSNIGKGWVCEIGDEVVGFSVASLRGESIWALFVSPHYEKRGIGTRLLRLAVNWLFEQGASTIVLTTAPRTRADQFYQQQGWTRGEINSGGEVQYSIYRNSGRMEQI
jgi:GNAT superfamily N-acetyltransferase